MNLRRVLAPEPASASTARRFASDVLQEWHEDAAADVVTLLVSELVTNALLHTGTPVEIGLRRRGRRLRVEVADQSPVEPGVRAYDPEAATGRGLGLVGLLAEEWGVERRPGDGKVVWFEVPATQEEIVLEPDDATQWSLPAGRHEEVVEVRLLGTPVQLFEAMQQHTEALLREYALITMQSDDHGRRVPRLDVDISSALEQLRVATNEGRPTADLQVGALARARRSIPALLTSFADAEQRAHRGQLLTAPALPEIAACREWFLTQVAEQLNGAAPQSWIPTSTPSGDRMGGTIDHRLVIDNLLEAVIVAGDDNCIAHANPAAESLLGWASGGLAGQRLTAIIPERLHEAHVAGYTRYLVTHKPRLVGEPVRVPARRRDGSEVDVELVINTFTVRGGRHAFVAALRPAPSPPVVAERPGVTRHRGLLEAALASLTDTAPEDAGPAVLAGVGTVLAWDVGAWWVPQNDGLRCAALWERNPGQHQDFTRATLQRKFAAGVGVPGRVWASKEPLWVPDVVADANFPRVAVAVRDGLRTACAFPVTDSAGMLLAVGELYSSRMLAEDVDVMEALRAVGRVTGWALRR